MCSTYGCNAEPRKEGYDINLILGRRPGRPESKEKENIQSKLFYLLYVSINVSASLTFRASLGGDTSSLFDIFQKIQRFAL